MCPQQELHLGHRCRIRIFIVINNVIAINQPSPSAMAMESSTLSTTNPEHETQSLPILINAALCENNTWSFLNPAVTAATNSSVYCYFSVPHPSSSIQHIPVNKFNNDSRVVGNMPAISNQYSGYTNIPFCHKHLQI